MLSRLIVYLGLATTWRIEQRLYTESLGVSRSNIFGDERKKWKEKWTTLDTVLFLRGNGKLDFASSTKVLFPFGGFLFNLQFPQRDWCIWLSNKIIRLEIIFAN